MSEIFHDRSHITHYIRETSRESYHAVEDLGEKQRVVYDCIRQNSLKGVHLTDREIASILHLSDPNKVRPRRFELMKMGLIAEGERRKCHITHRLAITWRVKE